MNILIKFPTRNRVEKSLETLKSYVNLAKDMTRIKIIVSLDEDDVESVSNKDRYSSVHENIEVVVGTSSGKVAAINRDIPDPSLFEILLLASDDMIPIVKGYDSIIRDSMEQFYPDTDGVLFYNDGYVGYRTNTLVICGSKYYQRFGYIYFPGYKSLFCDNEFTDEANRLGKQTYFNQVIIKHEHPGNNTSITNDNLYTKNDTYLIDESLYISRFKPLYDISILICTTLARHEQFLTLLEDIRMYCSKTSLRVQILTDSRDGMTIGSKRNALLQRATGLYCAFIDDDDKITPAYFEVIQDAIRTEENYDCIRLNGRYYENGDYKGSFHHSTQYDTWYDDSNGYYRCPNHLNPIKTLIVRRVSFDNISHGEDRDFSERLKEKQLVKSEYIHDQTQYLYYKVVEIIIIIKPIEPPRMKPLRWGLRQ